MLSVRVNSDDLMFFIREQELTDDRVENSLLPTLKLDVSDNDITAAVECSVEWFEKAGGLYMDD